MTNFFTGQNNVKIFFEYNDEVIQLPVNPEEFTVTTSGNNQTEEIIKLGQVNILKLPNLSEMSIGSFFPIDDGYPYVVARGKAFKTPDELVTFFEKPYYAKEPLRMIIANAEDENSTKKAFLLSIEHFESSFKGLDSDTHYKLDFKRYVNFGNKIYDTTFQIPVDDDGKFKWIKQKGRSLLNKYKSLRNKTKKLENNIKTINNFAQNATRSLNAIRTTGSIIGTNIK